MNERAYSVPGLAAVNAAEVEAVRKQASAVQAVDPADKGTVSAPDGATAKSSLQKLLEAVKTHNGGNYGPALPKQASANLEGIAVMFKQAADVDDEQRRKVVKIKQSDGLKSGLTGLATTLGGTALGATGGFLLGDAMGASVARKAGLALGGLLGLGGGHLLGAYIAGKAGWRPKELAETPGRVFSLVGGAAAGAAPFFLDRRTASFAPLGAVGGTLLANYLHKKITGTKYPDIVMVDDM